MALVVVVVRVLGYAYLAAAVLFILGSLIMVGIKDGPWEVAAILSPFNITNWIVTLLTIAPGPLLLFAAGKIKSRYVRPSA